MKKHPIPDKTCKNCGSNIKPHIINDLSHPDFSVQYTCKACKKYWFETYSIDDFYVKENPEKGDKVRMLGTKSYGWGWSDSDGIKKGDILNVFKTKDEYYVIKGLNFLRKDFEFPIEEDMNPKEGDKVKLLGTKSKDSSWVRHNFKKGDIFKIIHIYNINNDVYYSINGWNFLRKDFEFPIKTMEENKMELKNVKKENIAEAKKQAEEEKNNKEIEFAKSQYKNAENEINRLDREIKQLNEAKKPHQEVIDSFNKTK